MANISAINLSSGLVLDTEGNTYPITNWFDSDGDDCDPDEAVVVVAGTGGVWWFVDLREFTAGALA